MDLSKAKEEAAARSLASKKKVFINLQPGGVCILAGTQSDTTTHVYQAGKEIPLPDLKVEKKEKVTVAPKKAASKKITKTKKVMKKVAKKSPAKKVAANRKPIAGTEKEMTAKQLRAEVEAGNIVLNKNGNEISCAVKAKNNPGAKLAVVVGKKEGKKAFQLV